MKRYFRILILSLPVFVGLWTASLSLSDEIVPIDSSLKITIEQKSGSITYEIPNDMISSSQFMSLTSRDQARFLSIRKFYLESLAKLITRKSIGWIISRPDWIRNKLEQVGFIGPKENIEDSFQVDTGPRRWGAIRSIERRSLEKGLIFFDRLLWKDAKNISQQTDKGYLVFGQIQSGIQLGSLGLFLGGGLALDMSRDEESGKSDFSLSFFGERSNPDPYKKISIALEILTIRFGFGVQNKIPQGQETRVSRGQGWYLPGAPIVYMMYNGNKLATLFNLGLDVGTLTLAASAASGWFGGFLHHFPSAFAVFDYFHHAWRYILPEYVIKFIVPPLFIFQYTFTLQTKWKEFRLLSFSRQKRTPEDKEKIKTELAPCEDKMNF